MSRISYRLPVVLSELIFGKVSVCRFVSAFAGEKGSSGLHQGHIPHAIERNGL